MLAGRTSLATAARRWVRPNKMSSNSFIICPEFSPKTNIRVVLICLSLLLTAPTELLGAPSVTQIREDIRQLQQFFLSRFPDVPLEAYQDGVNALPQYSRKRKGWELLMEYPPYESEMLTAEDMWQAALPSGSSLKQCFTGKPPPTAYPYYFNGEIHTIVGDINRCLRENGAQELNGMSNRMALLAAAFKSPWSGQILDIDFRSEEIRSLYQKGRQYFWAKRGQLNLSCANCHVHNAGNQLRGDVLSAALGHASSYPTHSISWSIQGEPMGTLHRRYAQCNRLVGAAPLPAQSEEYIALEIYQTIMSTGVPIKVPSQRQ